MDDLKLSELQDKLGYTFNDPKYVTHALTHSSYTNENKLDRRESNERLEFLGDSLLGMKVAELIFTNKPDLSEGIMTKLRADMVCESSLAGIALELDLGLHILLGRGEIKNGGRKRPSLLADAFEALLAAVYLDGGHDALTCLIESIFLERINRTSFDNIDYKTELQEFIQLKPGRRLTYALIDEQGPDHDKYFTIELCVNGKPISNGKGKSKKSAEQRAAKAALELLL